ncbi:MAG: hypothetical protein ACJ8LN_05145, partial [Sulfurifustis sp.]
MPPHLATPTTDVESGFACLVLLARLYGIPADASQLKHQFAEAGRRPGEAELMLAAKHLGLKAGIVDS